MSDWMEEDRYDPPETYTVNVIPPGESTGYTLELNVQGFNKINKEDVGCIKDGVWCFNTISCGEDYKKSIGIFYNIECCIAKAYATEPERQEEAIKEIEMWVKEAKVAVELNQIVQATEFLELAQNGLERIKCNCD